MEIQGFYIAESFRQAQRTLDMQVMMIFGLLMLSVIAFLVGAGLMLRRSNKAVITDTTVVLE